MSALVDNTAETLLIEHLENVVGSYDVAWPNINYSPTIGNSYYRASFMYPEPERLTHSNTTKHKGIFQVDAVTPSNRGIFAALNMARTVQSAFENSKIAGNGITVEIIKPPSLGKGLTEKDWYFIPVSIVYIIFN